MGYRGWGIALAALAVVLSACSGSRSIPVAPSHGGGTTSPAGTPTPSATPSSSSSTSVAAVATALASVEAYYQTLPGTDPMSDVANVAAHMVSSGAFASATAGPGAISATLSDGTPVIVFTDRVADLLAPSDTRRRNGIVVGPPPGTSIGPATQHEVLFLVNELDSAAFTPANQQQFGQAFSNLAFKVPGRKSTSRPSRSKTSSPSAARTRSTFSISRRTEPWSAKAGRPAVLREHLEHARHRCLADAVRERSCRRTSDLRVRAPKNKNISTFTTFAFTPAFLIEHATFNPGAIVDNESCFGQSPLIATAVETAFQLAGAGQYLGWTKPVAGPSADQTDAFIFDRMLGEQSPVADRHGSVRRATHARRNVPLRCRSSKRSCRPRIAATGSASARRRTRKMRTPPTTSIRRLRTASTRASSFPISARRASRICRSNTASPRSGSSMSTSCRKPSWASTEPFRAARAASRSRMRRERTRPRSTWEPEEVLVRFRTRAPALRGW
jgi:hypothetical protein